MVIYSLRTVHNNLGDWLINRSLIHELASLFPVWLDIADVPKEFYSSLLSTNIHILQDRLDVSHCRSLRFLVKRVSDRRAREARFLFLSPGHVANPEGNGRVAWAVKSMASLVYPCFGITMVRCGCSFERLDSLNALLLCLFSRAAILVTREPYYGGQFRIRHSVLPDLILLHYRRRIVTKGALPSGGNLIMCIRNDRGSEAWRVQWITRVSKIATHLREANGWSSVVTYQCDSDREAALELVAQLIKDGTSASAPVEVDRSNYEELYGSAVCVLSNRLHAALTTLVLGGCGVGLVDPRYDAKIINAFVEAHLADFVIESRDALSDALRIAKRIHEFYKDPDSTYSIIKSARVRLRKGLRRALGVADSFEASNQSRALCIGRD